MPVHVLARTTSADDLIDAVAWVEKQGHVVTHITEAAGQWVIVYHKKQRPKTETR